MSLDASHSRVSENLNSLEQTEFYQVLVNSIQDYAIFLLDTNGCIATWNVGAQKLKGYEPQEIIGKHFSVFYSEKDNQNGKPAWELKECRKNGHIEDEGWRLKKDGSRFWANVVITALYDGDDEFIGYAKVTRDLTERKHHEDRLQSANQQLKRQHVELEALNHAKDEFISLASHQLRTPATGTKQFLGLVLDGYAGELSDIQKDYLQKAYDSNNRQIELVNSLLNVAQLDAGKVVLSIASVDIRALIADVIAEQRDSFATRRQKLELQLPDGAVTLNLDGARFRMVIENLVDNASKYTPKGGKIVVSLTEDQARVRIIIQDNGVGIDNNELSRLFSKFSRIPNELSESVGGSGLGLYWAHKIVSLHGGDITVESGEGSGSTFYVTLPKGATDNGKNTTS